MKIIYILNYQREIPPFAQIEVAYAKKYFDEVVFITRKLINDNSSSIKDINVRIIQLGVWRRMIALLKVLVQCLSRTVLRQIFQACRQKVFSLSYLKALILDLYVADQLYSACKNDSKCKTKYKKYVLACWFNGIAVAAARLQRNLHYTSYSFAHAFEVDPDRNPYVGYLMEGYKHKYLTTISFIANTVLNKYTKKVYPIIGIYNNTELNYLGTVKIYDTNSTVSNKFTICSCSSVNEIKRLHLLVDALANIKDIHIRWIHIGDGPVLGHIKTRAASVLNDNIECCFMGKLSNERVQEFYSNNSIDLFINVSSLEGLPVSIMEAMSYSIPCMATNVGGTKEIVNNNNGILLDADISPTELSAELVRFLKFDDSHKEEMQFSAFNAWRNKFNAAKNIANFYANMISSTYDKQ